MLAARPAAHSFPKLTDHRQALDALKSNLVDHLGGLQETLAYIDEMKLVQKAQPGMSGGPSVYGDLKREMYRETVDYLEQWTEEAQRDWVVRERVRKDSEAAEKRVAGWESKGKQGKSKL